VIEVDPKYNPIQTSDARYYIVTGGRGSGKCGRGSGKSYSINLLLLLLTFEAGHTILFTRFTLSSAYISIIPEFIDKIETLNLQDAFYITKDEIRNKLSGSKIIQGDKNIKW